MNTYKPTKKELYLNLKIQKLEIERLNNRIYKAIEYIKRYEQINGYYDSCYDGEYDTYSYDNVKEELLDILKGVDDDKKK